MEEMETVKESLRDSGQNRRMTSQRIIILDYLKKTRDHPTAEEVYRNVKSILPSITLATVYRNLHLLADEGVIRRITINKEYRFDAFNDSHQHIVCPKCGRISDLKDSELENALKKTVKKQNADSAKVIIYKLCAKCKK